MSIPPELWAEISRLLDEAMNLERSERDAWLLRVDAGDANIAAHVRRLLAAHDRAAFDVHLQTPHLARFRAGFPALIVAEGAVRFLERTCSGAEPV